MSGNGNNSMKEWLLGAVAQVGVPAGIAIYVLVELRGSLEKLAAAVGQLSAKLDVILALIQRGVS